MTINQKQLYEHLMQSPENSSFCQYSGFPLFISSLKLSRAENQDRALAMQILSDTKLIEVGILCDGMGGMIDGAECASLAIASFIHSFIKEHNLDIKDRLQVSVYNSNSAVYNKYKAYGGATLSAFALDSKGNFEAINIGDSRIYLVIDNKLKQMTIDDTPKGILGESGVSNTLLQHIGMIDIKPHVINLPNVSNVSKIILTSDGAHFIEHSTLEFILTQNKSSKELAEQVTDVAKQCGGTDNATILCLTNLILPPICPDIESVKIWDTHSMY